ncbi:hypothetical protein M0813_23734 [Anaeramoeba flamelloides]|uniref:BTB domain-containing protein n=1 Tax=Anaeramoeba flamelloides TaxID=1746091 RepID=A0ABQ8YA39_9EUKA|nr:hypothetical protein M0813_23734 [Anaeramoeba flamelloides]
MAIDFYGEHNCKNFFLRVEQGDYKYSPGFEKLFSLEYNIDKILLLENTTFILTNYGELYQIKDEGLEKIAIEEKILTVCCGLYHVICSTVSGKVFSYAPDPTRGNVNGQLGCGSFEDKSGVQQVAVFGIKYKCRTVHCGSETSFAVCEDGTLWGWGKSGEISYGYRTFGSDNFKDSQGLPVLIMWGVEKFYSGFAEHFFAKTQNGNYYAWGRDLFCQLGLSKTTTGNRKILHKQLTDLDPDQILVNWNASIVLTKNRLIYSSGGALFNGDQFQHKTFLPIYDLTNTFISKISAGIHYVSIIKENGKIYAFGLPEKINFTLNSVRFNTRKLKIQNNFKAFKKKKKNLTKQKKKKKKKKKKKNPNTTMIKLPWKLKNVRQCHQFICGPRFAMVTIQRLDPFVEDFSKLFEKKELTDFQLFGIPVHSLILQIRTGKGILEINSLLKKHFNNNAITSNNTTNDIKNNNTDTNKNKFTLSHHHKVVLQNWLKWCYFDKIENFYHVDYICREALKIEWQEKNLRQDLSNWWKLESSKISTDFQILVNQDIINTHKIILLARSQLFRAFFLSFTNKSPEKIRDYSRKSKQSIAILIEFLYTGEIQLNKLNNQIVKELCDAVEYYQLNSRSQLNEYLTKFKRLEKINLNLKMNINTTKIINTGTGKSRITNKKTHLSKNQQKKTRKIPNVLLLRRYARNKAKRLKKAKKKNQSNKIQKQEQKNTKQK